MESIISYFKRQLHKDASSVTIDKTIKNRCSHCGYGEILVGSCSIRSIKEDFFSSSNSSDNSDSEENIDFVYKTGCLSYDGEMTYN